MATILAVEDDRLSQRLIEKVFKNAGHQVLLADNVKDAVGLLVRRALVDLVVLDSHIGLDHGWDFAAEVRRRPLYRALPIIVYTGHTERQEVLRYAALKVQSLHVKPIKAEVLLAELERATKQEERSRVLPDPDEVCERLAIDRAEYAGLLLRAVTHFNEDRATVAQNLGAGRGPELVAALERIKSRARELGVGWMDDLSALLGEQIQRGDRRAIDDTLAAVDAIIQALRDQAGSILGPHAALAHQNLPREPHAPMAVTPVPPPPPFSLIGALARQMVDRPLWMFGAHFTRGQGAVESLMVAARAQFRPGDPVGAWIEAIDLIEAVPQSDLPQVAHALDKFDGFLPTCRRIVQRLTRGEATELEELDMLQVVTRLGVLPASLLAAIACVVRPKVVSPLELQPWRSHTAMVAMLAYELAQLMRRDQPQLLAAAALAHHLDQWTMAVTEPGWTGVVLAMVCHGASPSEAARTIFGESAADLGRCLLEGPARAPVVLAVAATRGRPEDALTPDAQIALCLIELATILAHTAVSEDPQALKQLRTQLLDPGYPAWSFLRQRGVALPRDHTELVDVAITLAASVSWTVREATR